MGSFEDQTYSNYKNTLNDPENNLSELAKL